MRALAAALALAVAVPASGEDALATLRVGARPVRQTVSVEAVVDAVRQAVLGAQVA
ncbi:MAG TPA: hypothetical protein PLM09_13320 [Casimicrobiaceae bacterium]|nr:hypothetical protein [Casimicrobiaceae bacterium]